MKGPCCAICKVGSINCDGNGWNPFKNLLTCFWITSTASSTTAAPRYVSEWWKPSTATSKPFLEGAVVTRISAIYCSRPNAWRSPRPNSSFFRKPPKMRVSTNSCAEPYFQISTLFLAYLTIILSWIGYHRSIKKSPIGLERIWGWGRFFADILLLIAYFVLVVSYNNFRRELLLLVLIFFLFFVWDQFKRRERPETEDSRARRGVTVLWFFAFLVLALFYCLHPPAESRACEDWIILLAAVLGTLLYR